MSGTRGQTTLDFAIGVSVFILVVVFVLAFIPGMIQPFESSTQQATAASDRLATQLGGDFLVGDVREPYLLDKGCVATFFALENSDGDATNDADAYADNDGVVRSTLFDIQGSNLYDGSCSFDVTTGVFSRLAIESSRLDVRVSLRADLNGDGTTGLLCLNADDPDLSGTDQPDLADAVVETTDPYASGDGCDMSGGDYDVLFATGDEPPSDRSSVVSARRVVQLDGGFSDDTSTAAMVVEVW